MTGNTNYEHKIRTKQKYDYKEWQERKDKREQSKAEVQPKYRRVRKPA